MATPPVSDDDVAATVAAYNANDRNQRQTAAALGCSRGKVQDHLLIAARSAECCLTIRRRCRAFASRRSQTVPAGKSIQQKPEHGEVFETPAGHMVKGVSALVDPDGREIVKWIKTSQDAEQREAAMRAVVEAIKDEMPRAEPVTPDRAAAERCNQYTVTDYHFGMMAWGEETGGADWDLKVAENALVSVVAYAIAQAPEADTAIFAQLGDLVHHDAEGKRHAGSWSCAGFGLSLFKRSIRVIRLLHHSPSLRVAEKARACAYDHFGRQPRRGERGHGCASHSRHFEDEPRVTVETSAGHVQRVRVGLDVAVLPPRPQEKGQGR
jgi:hypothetical protein